MWCGLCVCVGGGGEVGDGGGVKTIDQMSTFFIVYSFSSCYFEAPPHPPHPTTPTPAFFLFVLFLCCLFFVCSVCVCFCFSNYLQQSRCERNFQRAESLQNRVKRNGGEKNKKEKEEGKKRTRRRQKGEREKKKKTFSQFDVFLCIVEIVQVKRKF